MLRVIISMQTVPSETDIVSKLCMSVHTNTEQEALLLQRRQRVDRAQYIYL